MARGVLGPSRAQDGEAQGAYRTEALSTPSPSLARTLTRTLTLIPTPILTLTLTPSQVGIMVPLDANLEA